jgi:integrase
VSAIRRPASAYAIEFIALTAVRKTQALEAKWTEFPERHGANPQWHCPWQRTKTGKKRKRDHVIPLSAPALAVLDTMEEMQKANGIKSEYVFPGGRGGQSSGPMTSGSVVKFLKESLGRSDLTIHGFRTTFRSWAKQYFPEKAAIAELCLDHAVPALEAIYGRDADLGELCRPLLDAWGAYCERPAPLPAAKVHDSEARKRA